MFCIAVIVLRKNIRIYNDDELTKVWNSCIIKQWYSFNISLLEVLNIKKVEFNDIFLNNCHFCALAL